MSVINQMLRDLEQRNQNKHAAAQRFEPQAWPLEKRSSVWRWLVVVAILPVLAATWWLGGFHLGDATQTTIARNTQPQPASPLPVAQIAQVASSVMAQAAPELTASVPQLAKSQDAQQVIAEPQSHPTTVKTTAAVVEEPVVPPATLKLEAPATQQPITPTLKSESKPMAARVAELPHGNRDSGITPVDAPRANKRSPGTNSAESWYQRAKQSNSVSETEDNLEQALKIDPYFLPARTLLLQTMMKSGASDQELADFVDESLAALPTNVFFLKTRAHLFIKHRDYASAVRVLERVDIDGANDAGFLLLIGAAYQQLQQFAPAERVYRRLTVIQPEKAENWLGLAMAEEKLGQKQIAIDAYRQALDKRTLSADVVDYIDQRIAALN
jgi:MSHA biogenesis protein MshN